MYSGVTGRFDIGSSNAALRGTAGNRITFCSLTPADPAKLDGGTNNAGLKLRVNTTNAADLVEYITVEDMWVFNNSSVTSLDKAIAVTTTSSCTSPGCLINNITLRRIVAWDRNATQANIKTLDLSNTMDFLDSGAKVLA